MSKEIEDDEGYHPTDGAILRLVKDWARWEDAEDRAIMAGNREGAREIYKKIQQVQASILHLAGYEEIIRRNHNSGRKV